MHIFILHVDGSVTVEEIGQSSAGYISAVFPEGQLFRIKRMFGALSIWSVMNRDYKGNGPAWNFVDEEHIPEQVLFARMLMG